MNPHCFECGEEYNIRRRDLGYKTCLECGDKQARKASEHKKKCTAPAYNKGAYQYVGSREAARWLGR